MTAVALGDRVRLSAPMTNENSVIPVEEGMPAGTEGTVDWLGSAALGPRQIGVRWDNGRSLMLLDGHDRFVVLR